MRANVYEKLEKVKKLIDDEIETFDQYRLTGSLLVNIHIKEGMINIVDIAPKNTMKI